MRGRNYIKRQFSIPHFPTVLQEGEKSLCFLLLKRWFRAENWSLTVSFNPFRAALRQGRYQLYDSWCLSPTGYFFLGEKVPKTPHKGYPLMYPRLRGSPFVLALFVFGTRFAKREAFAPLARSCGDDLTECSFALVCLAFGDFVCSFYPLWDAETGVGPDRLLGRKSGASLR